MLSGVYSHRHMYATGHLICHVCEGCVCMHAVGTVVMYSTHLFECSGHSPHLWTCIEDTNVIMYLALLPLTRGMHIDLSTVYRMVKHHSTLHLGRVTGK